MTAKKCTKSVKHAQRSTSFCLSRCCHRHRCLIGSLSSDVLERRTSTGNGRFALLSRDFEQIFGQIVSVRMKTLGNINKVASRLIKRGKGSLPVDVRRSKTSLLKLPNLPSLSKALLKPRRISSWRGVRL